MGRKYNMAKHFFDTTVCQKLKNGGKVSAAWDQMNSNISAEILAEAGFDVLVIDMEHAHTTLPNDPGNQGNRVRSLHPCALE